MTPELTPYSRPRKARHRWIKRLVLLGLLLAGLYGGALWGINSWIEQQSRPILAQLGWPEAKLKVAPGVTSFHLEMYADGQTDEPLLDVAFSPLAIYRNLKEGGQIGTLNLIASTLNYGGYAVPFGPATLTLAPGVDGEHYSLQGQGLLANNAFTLEGDMSRAGNGHATLKLQLSDTTALLPLLPPEIQAAFTDVSLQGNSTLKWTFNEWQPPLPMPEGTVHIEKLDLTYNGTKLENIAGDVKLTPTADNPLQLSSAPSLRIKRADVGVPLTDTQVQFALSGNVLNIKSAQTDVLGGQITAKPMKVVLPPTRIQGELQASGLDLANILALGQLDGLSGNGRLSGPLPFSYSKGELNILEAVLSTAEAGQVAYAPAQPPAFMAEGGQAAIVGQVFNDFRYKTITLKLNGTFGKDLSMTTRLEGMNPNFYAGHPVAFNLNLTGALDSVLRQGMATGNLTAGNLSEMMKMEGTPP